MKINGILVILATCDLAPVSALRLVDDPVSFEKLKSKPKPISVLAALQRKTLNTTKQNQKSMEKVKIDPPADSDVSLEMEDCSNRYNYKCWKKGGHSVKDEGRDTPGGGEVDVTDVVDVTDGTVGTVVVDVTDEVDAAGDDADAAGNDADAVDVGDEVDVTDVVDVTDATDATVVADVADEVDAAKKIRLQCPHATCVGKMLSPIRTLTRMGVKKDNMPATPTTPETCYAACMALATAIRTQKGPGRIPPASWSKWWTNEQVMEFRPASMDKKGKVDAKCDCATECGKIEDQTGTRLEGTNIYATAGMELPCPPGVASK